MISAIRECFLQYLVHFWVDWNVTESAECYREQFGAIRVVRMGVVEVGEDI